MQSVKRVAKWNLDSACALVIGVVLAEGGINTPETVAARLSEESLRQATALYARKGKQNDMTLWKKRGCPDMRAPDCRKMLSQSLCKTGLLDGYALSGIVAAPRSRRTEISLALWLCVSLPLSRSPSHTHTRAIHVHDFGSEVTRPLHLSD